MNKVKFYAKCIFPTSTLSGGKLYEVFNESNYDITVINDNGNKVTTNRYRFDKIEVKKVKDDDKYVECINPGKFKYLTLGKKYKVINTEGKKYMILNDKNHKAYYGISYFTEIKKISETEGPKKVDKDYIECIYPKAEELTFKKKYKIVDEKDSLVFIKNDKGEIAKYLKKRFKTKS